MERTESMESLSTLSYPLRSSTQSSSQSSKISDPAAINSLSLNYFPETDRSSVPYSSLAIASNQGYNHGYHSLLSFHENQFLNLRF